MTSKNPLESADLLKRSKELDAREEYLDTRTKLLEAAPISLSVYEATVKAKTEQLETLQDLVEKATNKLHEIQRQHRDENSKRDLDLAYTKDETLKETEKLQLVRQEVSGAKSELKALTDDYKSQQTYFSAQEEQITQLESEGNERLLDLKGEVAKLEHQISALSIEKVNLKKEVDELTIETEALQGNYDQTEEGLKARQITLESAIEETRKDLLREQARYKEISLTADKKLAILKEKEESIMAKRDALTLERQELEEDKRRWNSTKSLYPQDML